MVFGLDDKGHDDQQDWTLGRGSIFLVLGMKIGLGFLLWGLGFGSSSRKYLVFGHDKDYSAGSLHRVPDYACRSGARGCGLGS